MFRPGKILLIAALLAIIAPPLATGRERLKAAVFGLEFLDVSHEGALQGVRADQEARLIRVNGLLKEMLAKGGLALVDLSPGEARVNAASPIRSCNGCEVSIARDLGADVAVSGVVRKSSNLILTLAVVVRDARSGKEIRVAATDIRGNTDESWMRGMDWLIRNRLLDPPLVVSP